jgi:hypothetical protein
LSIPDRRVAFQSLEMLYDIRTVLPTAMNPHIQTVAKAYQLIALVLGLPSLIGTLFFGAGALRGLLAGRVAAYQSSGSNDQMMRIFDGILKAVHGVGGFLLGIGQAIVNGLAILSLTVLLFSTALFFLGRGLNQGQGWARNCAMACMGVVGLVSLLAWLSVGRTSTIALLALMVCAGCGYALWALWQGFA